MERTKSPHGSRESGWPNSHEFLKAEDANHCEFCTSSSRPPEAISSEIVIMYGNFLFFFLVAAPVEASGSEGNSVFERNDPPQPQALRSQPPRVIRGDSVTHNSHPFRGRPRGPSPSPPPRHSDRIRFTKCMGHSLMVWGLTEGIARKGNSHRGYGQCFTPALILL